MFYNECEKIKSLIDGTFPRNLKENTLVFISYLNSASLTFERLSGYWKNQYYYSVKFKNESVCYILLNGNGDEKHFAPLTIWSDDSRSNWYENYPLSNDLKKIAFENVDYCVKCGSCSGGKQKIIFGNEFHNVCRTTFRFTNPTQKELELIKKLIDIRVEDIKERN